MAARRTRTSRFARISVLASLALVASISGLASAAIPDTDGTIHACIRNKKSSLDPKGGVRIVDADTTTCTSAETAITWNDGTTVAEHDHVGETWNVAASGLLLNRTGIDTDVQQLRLLPSGEPRTGARYSSNGLQFENGYVASINNSQNARGFLSFVDNTDTASGVVSTIEDSTASTAVEATVRRDPNFGVGIRATLEDSFGAAIVAKVTGENGSAIVGSTEADDTTFDSALALTSHGAQLIQAATSDDDGETYTTKFGVDGSGGVFAAGQVFASAFAAVLGEGAGDLLSLSVDDGENIDPRFVVDNDGDVFADGTYSSPAADVAERVRVLDAVRPGEVVEIDPDGTDVFRRSSSAYSPLVAGVVSTKPGVILGDGPTKHPVLALAGRVPVRVVDDGGSISPGDLLVASGQAGRAMRCDRADRCPGAVIGKALGSLHAAEGTITMLVMLA